MAEKASGLVVTLVFLDGNRQLLRELCVSHGITLDEAVQLSGLLNEHPSLAAGNYGLASYGKRMAAHSPVRDGQRIEILLRLRMPPTEARRLLARKKRASVEPTENKHRA